MTGNYFLLLLVVLVSSSKPSKCFRGRVLLVVLCSPVSFFLLGGQSRLPSQEPLWISPKYLLSICMVKSVGAGPTAQTLFTSNPPPTPHPEALKDTGVLCWFSAFAFLKILFLLPKSLDDMNITQRNSVTLMHFVIFVFSIEAVHRTVHFHTAALSSSALLSRASLAFLEFIIPDSLCFPRVTVILTHRSFALFLICPAF